MSWEFRSTGPRRPARSVSRHRRALAIGIAASTLVLGLGAGTAYAFFSAGSGSGSAISGNLRPVSVVSAIASPSTRLVPGATADLALTLDNQNGFPVTITGIAQDGPVTVVGGTGCTSDSGTWPDGVTLGNSGVSVLAQTGLDLVLASGTHDVEVPGAASMGTDSNSGCQGASFQIPVTVTVRQ